MKSNPHWTPTQNTGNYCSAAAICLQAASSIKPMNIRFIISGISPQLRYSSWDIAVLDNGPVLIEGNWDAEFYAEQMLMKAGNRLKYINKLSEY